MATKKILSYTRESKPTIKPVMGDFYTNGKATVQFERGLTKTNVRVFSLWKERVAVRSSLTVVWYKKCL